MKRQLFIFILVSGLFLALFQNCSNPADLGHFDKGLNGEPYEGYSDIPDDNEVPGNGGDAPGDGQQDLDQGHEIPADLVESERDSRFYSVIQCHPNEYGTILAAEILEDYDGRLVLLAEFNFASGPRLRAYKLKANAFEISESLRWQISGSHSIESVSTLDDDLIIEANSISPRMTFSCH